MRCNWMVEETGESFKMRKVSVGWGIVGDCLLEQT